MKKALILFALVLAMLFVVVAAADEAPDELFGTWKLTGDTDDMAEGEVVYYIINETEIASHIITDETVRRVTKYTVSGDTIVTHNNPYPVYFCVKDDVLELWNEDMHMHLVFTRVTDANAEAVAGIIGEWKLVELIGSDEASQGMAVITAMGGTITFTFMETEMILTMSLMGEVMEEPQEYTIVDGEIVSAGEGVPYVLDGDTLKLGDDEAGMVLVRIGSEAAAALENARKADSVIGTWTAVAMEGDEETAQMWAFIKAMGGSIELTITETTATMTMTVLGESEVNEADCVIDGNTVYLDGGMSICVLEDNVLRMTEGPMTMVFHLK